MKSDTTVGSEAMGEDVNMHLIGQCGVDGMPKEVLIKKLGTSAMSGIAIGVEFIAEGADPSLIGQFGVDGIPNGGSSSTA